MDYYMNEGYSRVLSSARVCQDIVLKAISEGPLNRNVTIKGGVVMRSITGDTRRATRDIDLDFIHYSIEDDSIRAFINKLNCLSGVTIEINGDIEELKHQDYNGKRIKVRITDETGYSVSSKIDIGVHKHFDIEQDDYCFDVCMDDEGASLLKNSIEQSFVEKLRSLLIFGQNSRRYKDIYDMYYGTKVTDSSKLKPIIEELIFNDAAIHENEYEDIVRRVTAAFDDSEYLKRISSSRQRWMDESIEDITQGIISFLTDLGLS